MDDETCKRIEHKLDFIAGLITGLVGVLTGGAILYSGQKYGWEGIAQWIAPLVFLILPAYLMSIYKNTPKN